MMANEYSYRTLKQNLIDGLSKKEFVISKFLMVLILSFISTFFVFGVSLILGLSYSDFTEPSIIFSDLEYLFAYFLKLVTFFSFCLFLGVWVKRSAFALGFLFIWFIFEKIIYGVLKWGLFRGSEIADKIIQSFPLEAMSNLIVEPISRIGVIKSAASQLGEAFTKTYEVPWSAAIICVIWTFLFVYFSYLLLKKRDL